MYYYLVPSEGSDTPTDPLKPDINFVPNKTQYIGVLPYNGTYLIATSTELPYNVPYLTFEQLKSACIDRGLDYSKVLQWSLGGA